MHFIFAINDGGPFVKIFDVDRNNLDNFRDYLYARGSGKKILFWKRCPKNKVQEIFDALRGQQIGNAEYRNKPDKLKARINTVLT